MKTYTEPQPEVIAEHKLASNIIRTKGLNQRIMYAFLGVGIILLVVGLISFLMK
jgi:hypothetical protein